MSSGSSVPPPVKAVAIPKKAGGVRILGVPPVADRVAQMVVKQVREPRVAPGFHQDAYGYRPGRAAAPALDVTRKRCGQYDGGREFDSKGLCDNLDHDRLRRAGRGHTENPGVRLYIARWRTAPVQRQDNTLVVREQGTPQGGGGAAPGSPISSGSTRLTGGWRAPTRRNRSPAMPTMPSGTVGARPRPNG